MNWLCLMHQYSMKCLTRTLTSSSIPANSLISRGIVADEAWRPTAYTRDALLALQFVAGGDTGDACH